MKDDLGFTLYKKMRAQLLSAAMKAEASQESSSSEGASQKHGGTCHVVRREIVHH